MVVSALGFGVAYYFDTENGGLRRKRLHQQVQRTLHNVESVLFSDLEDEPPVFQPVHAFGGEGRARRGPARVGTVR